jgi:RNA polymerase sigma factor (sigma-70 family)
MNADSSFRELIRRVRRGDQAAAEELVRKYEPAVRMEVRVRLVEPKLRSQIDSLDICQSVLGSFFIRMAAGQYDLEEPGQLVKLLVTMTRNKLASRARREQAERRDYRRLVHQSNEPVDSSPSPSQAAAARELLEETARLLTEGERKLVELRGAGHDWESIAQQLGGSPVLFRKRLSRALNRVARRLGLEDEHEN